MLVVKITPAMRERAFNFASQIIRDGNQYNRLPTSIKKRIERTFVGKLAEYVFLIYLRRQGINYPEGDMFTIYPGERNVDGYDFITNNSETVDIKSAYKNYHRRIMVPIDQFENIPKNYYVGIKFVNTDLSNNGLVLRDSINQARIYGFCTYDVLRKRPTEDYGEGLCKAIELDKLDNIDVLVNMFR